MAQRDANGGAGVLPNGQTSKRIQAVTSGMDGAYYLSSMEYPEDQIAALERETFARIDRERGPRAWLRATPRAARVALVLAVVVAEVAYYYLTRRRRDWDVYPAARMALALLAMAGVLGVALWDALRPLHQATRPPWAARGLIAAGLVLPAFLGLLPELPTLSKHYHGLGSDLGCLKNGVVLGLGVMVAIWLVARDPSFFFYGAIAGALAGLLVLQVECPYNARQHLLVGHATIPLALLGVAWIARRIPILR